MAGLRSAFLRQFPFTSQAWKFLCTRSFYEGNAPSAMLQPLVWDDTERGDTGEDAKYLRTFRRLLGKFDVKNRQAIFHEPPQSESHPMTDSVVTSFTTLAIP